MTTRRQFIHTSAALGVVAGALGTAALDGAALGGGRLTRSVLDIHRVIVDDRFEAARLFGAEASSRGCQVTAISAAACSDPSHRWRESLLPVAGITGFRALLLLEMMAGDVGMRVIYRMHHHQTGDQTVTHEVFGPNSQRELLAQRMERAGSGWPRQAARAVAAWPASLTSIRQTESNIGSATRRALDGQTLVSWIIARPNQPRTL